MHMAELSGDRLWGVVWAIAPWGSALSAIAPGHNVRQATQKNIELSSSPYLHELIGVGEGA